MIAIDTTHAETDYDKAVVGRENAWFDQLAPADKDEGVARAVAGRKFAVSVETAEKGYQVGVASAEHLYQMMLGMGAGSSAAVVRTAALAASEVIRSSLRRSADVTLAIDNADATLAWDVTMAGADRDWSSGDSTDYKNLRGSLASADHAYATSLIPHGTTRDLASMSATIDYWNKDLLAANTWNLSVAQSMADFRGADLAARATALSHLSLTLNSGPLPWMQFRADLAAQESAWWSGTATTPGFRATYLQWFANSNASRTAYQQTVNTLYTSLCGSQTAADATRSASLANAEQTAENGYAAKDDAYGQAMANATCCYVVTAAHAKRNYAVSLAMAAAFQTAPNTAAYSGQMASARQSYASAEVSSLSIWRTGTANVNLACVTDTSSAETSWVSSTAAARKGYAIGEATANATMRVGLAGHERTYREQEVGTYHTAMVALATANGSPWAQLAADEAFGRYNYALAIGQPWVDYKTALANADRDQEQAGAAAEEILSNSLASASAASKLSAAQAALTRSAALNAADAALLSSGHYAPNLPANIVDSLFTASSLTDLTDLTDPSDLPDPPADSTFDYLIAHSFERSPQTGATLPSDDPSQYSYWRAGFGSSDHLRERLVRPKPPEVALDQHPSAPPQLAAQAATGVSSTAETTAPGGSSTSGAKSSFGTFQQEVKTNGAANTNASTLTTTQFKNLQSTAPQVAAEVRPTQSPPGGGSGGTSPSPAQGSPAASDPIGSPIPTNPDDPEFDNRLADPASLRYSRDLVRLPNPYYYNTYGDWLKAFEKANARLLSLLKSPSVDANLAKRLLAEIECYKVQLSLYYSGELTKGPLGSRIQQEIRNGTWRPSPPVWTPSEPNAFGSVSPASPPDNRYTRLDPPTGQTWYNPFTWFSWGIDWSAAVDQEITLLRELNARFGTSHTMLSAFTREERTRIEGALGKKFDWTSAIEAAGDSLETRRKVLGTSEGFLWGAAATDAGALAGVALPVVVHGIRAAGAAASAGSAALGAELTKIFGQFPAASLQCVEAARQVQQVFMAAGTKCNIILFVDKSNPTWVYKGVVFAKGGWHVAVYAGGKVYDALFPAGVSLAQYLAFLNAIGVTPTIKVGG